MVERNNPQYAGELRDINKAWAGFKRVERAASMGGAKEGVFTPSQLASAVKALDSSGGKRATARGQAMMQDIARKGEETIGSKYPDSGTAGRILTAMGAGGAYFANPLLAAGEVGLAGLYGTKSGQKALMALIAKRPEMAKLVAEKLRAASLPAGRIGAIGGGYLAQQNAAQ